MALDYLHNITNTSQHENVSADSRIMEIWVLILTPTDRTKRVKDARSEAQKEIEDYRKQKDEEFKKFEKEVRQDPYASHHPSTRPTTAGTRYRTTRESLG